MNWQEVYKYLAGAAVGVIAMLEPLGAFVFVCFLAVIIDCYSAFRLSVRVKKKYGKSKGKFQSKHGKKMISTFFEIAGVLLLVFVIDRTILGFEELYLTKLVSGIFCFLQLWSILENASSESDSKWMKPLQRILVNKAERHFDIELGEVMKEQGKVMDKQNNVMESQKKVMKQQRKNNKTNLK